MTSRGKDLDKLAKDLQKLEEQSTADQELHVAAQKQYQAVTAGLSSNDDGQAATLNDQLMSKYNVSLSYIVQSNFNGSNIFGTI